MSLPIYSDVQLAGSLAVSGKLQSSAPVSIRSAEDDQKELIRIWEPNIDGENKSLEIYIPSEQTIQIKQLSTHIKIEPYSKSRFHEFSFRAASSIDKHDIDTNLTKIEFSKLGYTFTIKWHESSSDEQAWNLFLYTDCDVEWGASMTIYRGYDGYWKDDPMYYKSFNIPHQKTQSYCLVDDDAYRSDNWDRYMRLLCAKVTLHVRGASISIPDIPVDINIANKIQTLTFNDPNENYGHSASYSIEFQEISNAVADQYIWVDCSKQPTKILAAYDAHYEPISAGYSAEINDRTIRFYSKVSGTIYLMYEVISSGALYKFTQEGIECWTENGLKRKRWSKFFNMIPD